ncbi:virion structural protein [Pseudomonas phage 201phi2-1]|uniref:Virion structural protein n=1 Tax=Pseudomonas phage 201phi2-1 TaxID=198110 RepID=B3FJ80_BP201|nr:virion structural protein [Pseudomonas phage 201phi2-1]ABY63047.1 virion structural protein [Pseudomonas phage 201phi2-1]
MADIYVKYPYDPTGKNADNLVSGELHTLTPVSGFPYKIITMNNGGFYARTCRVYDADYNRLVESVDYILTYRYAHLSQMLGLEVVNDIVFLDQSRVGSVYISAQMVGSDVAFSLTGIPDYVEWYSNQEAGYLPRMFDYNGNEPEWGPGELDKERWRLDTYQPFNNEIYELSRAAEGGRGVGEDNFRKQVKDKYNAFLAMFTDRLQRHIDDKDNPHVTTKNHLKLGLLQNYRLATVTESRQGVSNALYQTPELSWQTIDALAMQPLNSHITNYSNPHQTTPEKIDSPRKTVVDSTIASKYLDNETVANANLFMNGATGFTYSQYYAAVRSNIPAASFAVIGGYLNPYRLGRGSPASNTVLRSGPNPSWQTIDSLIIEAKPRAAPGLMAMAFPGGTTPSNAFNAAIQQPWAYTANLGSIICYRLTDTYVWGAGNGAWGTSHSVLYVAYKSAGGWVQV